MTAVDTVEIRVHPLNLPRVLNAWGAGSEPYDSVCRPASVAVVDERTQPRAVDVTQEPSLASVAVRRLRMVRRGDGRTTASLIAHEGRRTRHLRVRSLIAASWDMTN
jgi:hypothetical protein